MISRINCQPKWRGHKIIIQTYKVLHIVYLSKVLTERFSIVYKTQTKEDIRFYILTLVIVDINFTFSAKVWIQL